jgi:hypothetical protein
MIIEKWGNEYFLSIFFIAESKIVIKTLNGG